MDNTYATQLTKLRRQLEQVTNRLAAYDPTEINSMDMGDWVLYSDLLDQQSALQEAIWLLED